MRVHQGKSQDDDLVSLQGHIDAVHPVDEVVLVIEHDVYGVSVGTEVPAVLDRHRLAFDKRGVESKIRNDLPEQFHRNLHLRIQRRLWLLEGKDKCFCR